MASIRLRRAKLGDKSALTRWFVPGVKRMAPLTKANSLTLILSPLHLTKNIWIPSATAAGTPGSSVPAQVSSPRCIKIACSRLGRRVSTVSKRTESCTSPTTSSGAQVWRTSKSWSPVGKPRKQATCLRNLKVFASTCDAAVNINNGARIVTSLLGDAQEHKWCAAAISSGVPRRGAPLVRMLYRMLPRNGSSSSLHLQRDMTSTTKLA